MLQMKRTIVVVMLLSGTTLGLPQKTQVRSYSRTGTSGITLKGQSGSIPPGGFVMTDLFWVRDDATSVELRLHRVNSSSSTLTEKFRCLVGGTGGAARNSYHLNSGIWFFDEGEEIMATWNDGGESTVVITGYIPVPISLSDLTPSEPRTMLRHDVGFAILVVSCVASIGWLRARWTKLGRLGPERT